LALAAKIPVHRSARAGLFDRQNFAHLFASALKSFTETCNRMHEGIGQRIKRPTDIFIRWRFF
jgi:hypothetical protein